MKQLFVIVIFFLTIGASYSQDLIVTNQGDSIECKITKVSEQYVHFTVYDGTGLILTRSRLPLSEVASYAQAEDASEATPPPEQEIKREDLFVLDSYSIPNFRLAVNSGFTYQFAGYDGRPNSYKNQVQTLWGFGGELDYFFPRTNVGIGFKYHYAFTRANEDFLLVDGSILELRDELIQFNYYGIAIILRKIASDDQVIQFHLTGGTLLYRSDYLLDGVPFNEEGDTFGGGFGVGYDYRLSERFGVGISLDLMLAQLSQIAFNGNPVNLDFDVSRIDLTVGLRIYK